jgi:hypothetical protein
VQFHGFSRVPPNDKRLIFNHRSILKEINIILKLLDREILYGADEDSA